MRFTLISDNTDTLMGLRLVGIDGIVVHTYDEALEALNSAITNPDNSIVLMTSKVIAYFPHVVSELKLKQSQVLIVEIPDRRGNGHVGETLDKYVSDAIGIKL